MESIKKITGMLGMVILVFSLGCASSGSTTSSTSESGSSIEVDNPSLTLADYMRKVSGLSVQGSGDNIRVYIRGVNTAVGNNQPLYVIDGRRAGHSYQQVVDMVDVNDIDRIRVVKGSEAGSRYGLEGSGGVVEIKTKSD